MQSCLQQRARESECLGEEEEKRSHLSVRKGKVLNERKLRGAVTWVVVHVSSLARGDCTRIQHKNEELSATEKSLARVSTRGAK